jgi:exonuclease VII small subunit
LVRREINRDQNIALNVQRSKIKKYNEDRDKLEKTLGNLNYEITDLEQSQKLFKFEKPVKSTNKIDRRFAKHEFT